MIADKVERNWTRIQDNLDIIGRLQDEIAAHPLRLRRNRRLMGQIYVIFMDNERLREVNDRLIWGS